MKNIYNYIYLIIFSLRAKMEKELVNSYGKRKIAEFNFELISKYHHGKEKKTNDHILSDKTLNDIDFQELFKIFDRTISSIGQQFLYDRLVTISDNIRDHSSNEKFISQVSRDADLRLRIQKNLYPLQNKDAYFITSLFQDILLKKPQWYFMLPVLSISMAAMASMITIYPMAIIGVFIVFAINLGIHLYTRKKSQQYISSIPQLNNLINAAEAVIKLETVFPVNEEIKNSVSKLRNINRKTFLFKAEPALKGVFDLLLWYGFEMIKIVFLIEPIIFFRYLEQIKIKQNEITIVFRYIAEIDTCISIASLRSEYNDYSMPTYYDNPKKIQCKDMYHPMVKDCITNDFHIDNKSILLTGSNMSGKTTFIRTLAVNLITSYNLNTSFSSLCMIPLLNIFSALRISDDLLNDKSYYFEEVLTIKTMMDHGISQSGKIFFLDEIFKGTNTVERISAGKAILSALAKNNIVIVSTHDIELAELLKEEYDLYHFSEIVDNKTVDFDYKIKPGKLMKRNAIRILELNGYPDSVIKEALSLSAKFKNNII